MFNKEYFKKLGQVKNRYEKRVQQLQDKWIITDSIEEAVENSIKNIQDLDINSFVIYWEPQSWKTELMIALTAKLLDEWKKIIVLLVNDNVQLLSQNLDRFKKSWLDPAPYKFSEILDKNFKVSSNNELIVFCTKNSHNLRKLIEKIWDLKEKVIIDDEADYATPNSKINKWEITKINELVWKLKLKDGIFIWVTATPARLDLNNTFGNKNANWVHFKPHPLYTWQEIFFPDNLENIEYWLELLPDVWDDPKYLRNALFNFMVNVAYLNTIDDWKEKNYCMLVHTSWKKVDHSKDHNEIIKVFNILSDVTDKKHEKYLEEIYSIAKNKFLWFENKILEYIVINKNRKSIVIINCDWDKDNVDSATEPNTPFTIAIWWNIVSRWVTFNNLLCMFFTRDVKHKIQQDTYIQRARMFGTRWKYLKYFMLFIPEWLFIDWQRAFIYHRFALETIKDGNWIVWLEDPRISAAASTSIDKVNIWIDTWEISYNIIKYSSIRDIIEEENKITWEVALSQLEKIHNKLWDIALPEFLINFIKNNPNSESIIFVNPLPIDKFEMDKENIIRQRKWLISDIIRANPWYLHYFRILYYSKTDTARIFYRYYNNSKISFLRNKKHD